MIYRADRRRFMTYNRKNITYIIPVFFCYYVARVGAVGSGTALQAGRSWVRFPIMSLEFFIDIGLPGSIWSWG
jgi:ABC-type uncharacterized transport system permease subunit